ncbi:MAG TPA: hypothetical protein VIU43_00870 [Nitrosospira sp.]
MKLWSDFYDLAAPDVPGCPLAALDIALRQAAISFCEHTLAWRYDHPDIPVVSNMGSYTFSPPAGAVVAAIIYAEFNGREIGSSIAEADKQMASWRNQTGIPEYILGSGTSLMLAPVPGASGILTMTVALKPAPGAGGIEDFLFDEYRETIIHGALARLMLSPKKPYMNVQLAQYHDQQFAIRMADAGMRAARSYIRAPLRTRIMGRG